MTKRRITPGMHIMIPEQPGLGRVEVYLDGEERKAGSFQFDPSTDRLLSEVLNFAETELRHTNAALEAEPPVRSDWYPTRVGTLPGKTCKLSDRRSLAIYQRPGCKYYTARLIRNGNQFLFETSLTPDAKTDEQAMIEAYKTAARYLDNARNQYRKAIAELDPEPCQEEQEIRSNLARAGRILEKARIEREQRAADELSALIARLEGKRPEFAMALRVAAEASAIGFGLPSYGRDGNIGFALRARHLLIVMQATCKEDLYVVTDEIGPAFEHGDGKPADPDLYALNEFAEKWPGFKDGFLKSIEDEIESACRAGQEN